MDGATFIRDSSLERIPVETGWNVAGVSDFNKDGRSDILWRNSVDGQVGVWEMSGSARIGIFNIVPTISPSSGWNIV
jgi:hypothetical protein